MLTSKDIVHLLFSFYTCTPGIPFHISFNKDLLRAQGNNLWLSDDFHSFYYLPCEKCLDIFKRNTQVINRMNLFQGMNVKNKVPILLEVLDNYDLQNLVEFFEGA